MEISRFHHDILFRGIPTVADVHSRSPSIYFFPFCGVSFLMGLFLSILKFFMMSMCTSTSNKRKAIDQYLYSYLSFCIAEARIRNDRQLSHRIIIIIIFARVSYIFTMPTVNLQALYLKSIGDICFLLRIVASIFICSGLFEEEVFALSIS